MVDDHPANLLALEAILDAPGLDLIRASSGQEALARLQEGEFAVVLLDVLMSGLDGFETARLIREREHSRHTPIIFLTAAEVEREVIERAYSLGAVDFLIKPVVPIVLSAKVAVFVDLFEKTRQVHRQSEELRAQERRSFEERLAEEDAHLREHVLLACLRADASAAFATGKDLPAVLQECAEALVRHLGAAFARIWTIDEKAEVLCLQASAGLYTHLDGAHARVGIGQFKIGRIALQRQPHLTNAVQEDPWIGDPAWARREGMVAFAGYPLLAEGRLVGVMAMFARQPLSERILADLAPVADSVARYIERRWAAEALRESEERFRTLADSIPQLAWMTRADGHIFWYNQRWYDYTGTTPQQMERQGWQSVLDPTERSRVLDKIKEAFASGEPWEDTFPLLRHDGVYRWHLSRMRPVKDDQGRVLRWFGTNTDITERMRMEQALRQAREDLEARVRARTRELAEANDSLRQEVGERQLAEQKALANAAELQRSNRELEQFASVASHDLQEPLRKIQAFGDRLQARYAEALGEGGREYLDRMRAAAARMSTLINDLLTFSRVTTRAQPFALVDLAAEARQVVSDLEGRTAQTGGRIELGELPVLHADPTQVRQLLQNLIANGLKFHRPEEPPLVRVEGRLLDEGPPGERVCEITVRDNGIGFEEKYRERIFQLFQRLHGRGEYEGTGIGLAICRKIVERHGGTITAHGTPGQGSTFIVTLPDRPDTEERAP